MNEFNCPTDIGGLLTLKFPNGRKKFYPVHRGHYSDAENLVSAIMGTLSKNYSCNIPESFWKESNFSWVWSPVNWEIPCQILSLEKIRNSRFVVTSRGKTITLEGNEEIRIFQQFLYFCNMPKVEIDWSRPVDAVIRLEAWNSFLKDYAKKLMS